MEIGVVPARKSIVFIILANLRWALEALADGSAHGLDTSAPGPERLRHGGEIDGTEIDAAVRVSLVLLHGPDQSEQPACKLTLLAPQKSEPHLMP
jgi:hypothetical protein